MVAPAECDMNEAGHFPHEILRLPDVMRITGLARSTIWALIKTGRFPPPVALTKRARGWPREGVEQWIAERPVAAQTQQP